MSDFEEAGRRLSYKFRLYPNEEQQRYFQVNFGCVRYVYNYFLAARINAYKATKPVLHDGTPNPLYDPTAKSMSLFDTTKALTQLKKDAVDDNGHRWLYDADSSALLFALRNLDKAYQNFFRRVRQGGNPGFPKFKTRDDSVRSFTVKSCKILDKGHVELPKIGIVAGKFHREVEGVVTSATISRNAAGQYYISVKVKDADAVPLPELDNAVGVTFGIDPLAVTSEGEVFESAPVRKLERKLEREQRRLSRKVFGSNNYNKQKLKVARIHLRIANVRNYGIHCLTRQLVNTHGVIVSREMASQQMTRSPNIGKRKLPKAVKRKLNRSIANASFYEINRQLAYKASWAARTFVLVPKDTPTAQVCADCGHREVEAAESHKPEWTCSACGKIHNRKYNGAVNVLQSGLDILAGTEQSFISIETSKARGPKGSAYRKGQ